MGTTGRSGAGANPGDAAERKAALGRLAAGMSHDFRNVLWAIDLHAGLLETDGAASPAALEVAGLIHEAVSHGMALAGQAMDFARPGTPTGELDLGEAVRALEPTLAHLAGSRRRLVLDLAPVAAWVRFDRDRLEQVLVALVGPARHDMPDGATIRITTALGRIEDAAAASSGTGPGTFAVLTVNDSGREASPDDLARMFEPYAPAWDAGGGAGLGLAIAFRVVDAAGGALGAESAPGHGTTFRMLVPCIDEPAPESPDAG